MDRTSVTVRPIAEQEVALVERHIYFDWAASEKHADRCRAQERGDVVYVVAWVGERPVGHTLIKWSGCDVETISSQLHGCPETEDLFVVPNYRSKGIGSLILSHAERLAEQHGYVQIGLGVDVENPSARRLYERLGYTDAGLGEYRTSWPYLDREGREQLVTEVCNYLVKPLH